MQVNPEKIQAIAVGKKNNNKKTKKKHTHAWNAPNFGSVNITCEEVVKLLGVDIDSQFCFVQYVFFSIGMAFLLSK